MKIRSNIIHEKFGSLKSMCESRSSTFPHRSIGDSGLIRGVHMPDAVAQLMSEIPMDFPVQGQKLEEEFNSLGEECCHGRALQSLLGTV